MMRRWATVLLVVGRGAISLVDAFGRGRVSANDLAMISGFAFFVSISTVASIWTLLQLEISITRIVILVLAIAVPAMTLLWFYEGGSTLFANTAVMSQLLIMVVMLLLRMQGYRFMRAAGATGPGMS